MWEKNYEGRLGFVQLEATGMERVTVTIVTSETGHRESELVQMGFQYPA